MNRKIDNIIFGNNQTLIIFVKNKKMNKNLFIILLVIISLLSLGYGFYQQSQVFEAQSQVLEAQKQVEMAEMQATMAKKQAEMAMKAEQQAKVQKMRAIEELNKLKK